jgi:hypothetical protein
MDRLHRVDPHAALVKQPEQQPLARQIRIDQLDILDRSEQRRLSAQASSSARHARSCLPARRRDADRPAAHALRLRQELDQHAAAAPAMFRAVAAAQFLADRKPHLRRNLFGAQEVFVRGVFQIAAFQRTSP